jgi:hypothetical protein
MIKGYQYRNALPRNPCNFDVAGSSKRSAASPYSGTWPAKGGRCFAVNTKFHRQKVAEREKAEGAKADYEMTVRGFRAFSKGELVGAG